MAAIRDIPLLILSHFFSSGNHSFEITVWFRISQLLEPCSRKTWRQGCMWVLRGPRKSCQFHCRDCLSLHVFLVSGLNLLLQGNWAQVDRKQVRAQFRLISPFGRIFASSPRQHWPSLLRHPYGSLGHLSPLLLLPSLPGDKAHTPLQLTDNGGWPQQTMLHCAVYLKGLNSGLHLQGMTWVATEEIWHVLPPNLQLSNWADLLYNI